MQFRFVRNEEFPNTNIGVEIESTGKSGGDGSYHNIKISNPCALNFYLEKYEESITFRNCLLESIEFSMNGDWELSETIDALEYILRCLKEIKGGQGEVQVQGSESV